MLKICALSLVICSYVACGEAATLDTTPTTTRVSAIQSDAPDFLSGADLEVASKVDTTGIGSEVVKVLRSFFDHKMEQSEASNQDYWLAEDYEQFVRDYSEIRYGEYGPDATVKYWPTLMSIDRVRGHSNFRFANVRWASRDSTGSVGEVRYVFQFLVKPNEAGQLRLTNPLEVLTEVWKREKVGSVTFVLSPKHEFSRKQAAEQHAAIDEMVNFFEIDPFPITFYSFQNATEVLQSRGYLMHPLFYKFATGGQAGVGDVVYSGNDRDEYTHEVVHLFIARAIPTSTGILNEGLATLLGGSTGYPYEWHAEKLKAWLEANPDVDLTQHLNPYQSTYIEEHTSIPYTIGATLCEKLLKAHGREVLFEALGRGKDPWAFLQGLGIEQSDLRKLLQ